MDTHIRRDPARVYIGKDEDLTGEAACTVIGQVPLPTLTAGMDKALLDRPRGAYAPVAGRELPQAAPAGLKALYNIAAADMRQLGHDPDKFHMYTMIHAGEVAPGDALRVGFYHFDLRRMLRQVTADGLVPMAINYSVSSDFPTVFAARLASPDGKALPALATALDESRHQLLGDFAAAAGGLMQPAPGQVTRYNTMVLHRGGQNPHAAPRHRVFMHIAFSPVAPSPG